MSENFEDLLQWLQGDSRTWGWGCLLAWDRARVNSLLLQEYIAGFGSDSYLPPFTGEVDTSGVSRELIYDYLLDCPRLSFENASFADPRARLRMKVIGGAQLSVVQNDDGSPRLDKVSAIDVLAGPSLHMNLALRAVHGENHAGRVVLDLAKGGQFDLTFADNAEGRALGGEYFKKRFEALPDQHKVFVLGELLVPPGDVLHPETFEIRTHARPGDPSAGAVLFMIGLRYGGSGAEPPSESDLRYLLEGGYDFTLLLSRDFLLGRFFSYACEAFSAGSTPFVPRVESPPTGPVFYLHAASGAAHGNHFSRHSTTFASASMGSWLPMASPHCQFNLSFSGNDIVLQWQGVYNPDIHFELKSGLRFTATAQVEFSFKRAFRLSLVRSEGLLEVVEFVGGAVSTCVVDLKSTTGLPPEAGRFKAELGGEFDAAMIDHFRTGFDSFKARLKPIPIDHMTRLLFRGQEYLRVEKTGFLRDLALFGKIAPASMVFYVQPAESLMGPGETRLFYTQPLRTASWTVEPLPGESGPVGSINDLGLYTAPRELAGSFLRVRVTATSQGHSSSALVTVLTSEISVNPLIMVHSAGSVMGREMVAGARSPGTLSWSLVDPGSGSRIVPSQLADGDMTYYPGPAQAGVVFSIDEIKVTHEQTRRSRTVPVLLTHLKLTLKITASAEAGGRTIALKAWYEGAQVPPEFPVEWQVLLGDGSVDATSGVFTPGDKVHYRYSIVTAKVHWTDSITSNGYLLLPVPFIELPSLAPSAVRLSRPAERQARGR